MVLHGLRITRVCVYLVRHQDFWYQQPLENEVQRCTCFPAINNLLIQPANSSITLPLGF